MADSQPGQGGSAVGNAPFAGYRWAIAAAVVVIVVAMVETKNKKAAGLITAATFFLIFAGNSGAILSELRRSGLY